MTRVGHVIGNGDGALSSYKPARGFKITCNLPPMHVENTYGTCLVDFKMMRAISDGSVQVPGDWIMGARPHHYINEHANFRMRYNQHFKEYYMVLPEYVKTYTDFNCGHFATHYTANHLECEEIHMYGFNSMFDMDLRSCTDLYLNSERADFNNLRLSDNWRPIWQSLFKEFPKIQFVIWHHHDKIKFRVGDNVEIKIIKK